METRASIESSSDRLKGLLGNESALVRYMFEAMDIADRIIGDRGEPLFPILRPTEPLALKSLDAYRHHCRELIARVEAGEDTRPATDAELLCACLDASLIAPPTSLYGGLIGMLCVRVLGDLPPGLEVTGGPREPYPGAYDEELATLRRRFRQDWRRLPHNG